jgi:hypothetical protein
MYKCSFPDEEWKTVKISRDDAAADQLDINMTSLLRPTSNARPINSKKLADVKNRCVSYQITANSSTCYWLVLIMNMTLSLMTIQSRDERKTGISMGPTRPMGFRWEWE